jgi:hypothetical protein
MWVFPYSETTMFAFYIHILCEHLDWQISSMAQIFNVLEPAFSTVVELTLDYTEHSLSEEWHNQVDGALWQKLLGSFKNVKTLRVHEGLIGEISRSLPLDEEPPLTLLPKLEVLVRPEGSHYNETFAPFIHQRLLAHQRIDLSSSAFPVGRIHYVVQSPAGLSHIRPVDRETSIDTRRWRDDGKREERLAARRELRDKEYRERVRDREKERGFP